MKKILIIVGLNIALFFASSIAARTNIKVAILDNFRYQKYVTTEYKKYYKEGIDLAVSEAKKRGLNIEYKVFQYKRSPLAIINILPLLFQWDPDFIIGPRDSNKFLLLGKHINDRLVVSPFATSMEISKMPDNFFSITLPTNIEAKAMFQFIKKKFPKKKVYIITEADCKSCVDVSEQFQMLWNGQIRQKYFVGDDINVTAMKSLLSDYNKEDIILLPNTAHVSAVLMAMITNYLNSPVIFVGGDGWGAWNDTEVGKLKANKRYYAYHIVPWGLELCNADINNFVKSFKEFHQFKPRDKMSYLSFRTLMSIVDSYQKHKHSNISIKHDLLDAYISVHDIDQYWYKPKDYLVYEIYDQKNTFHSVVNPIDNKFQLSSLNCKQYD